eukprot:TRINITY_DN23261_c0_g1_i1.p1 TRINITY_DN23261_c0_g1~~TRINITY_DN23261_c0_g1_i1.p1  ORF type:complete len:403 (-),score=87.46 TRINITY_DN23261_c0_g1_i1:129-1337(-)
MPRLLGQLLDWLAQPSDDLQTSWPTLGRNATGKPWQGVDHPGADGFLVPHRRLKDHIVPVSFGDNPPRPKCLCPAMGHCVPGNQCPKGEHVDPSKCFNTIDVKFPPDPEYVRCLRMKESDPEKECELQMLKMPGGIKLGQFGLPFFEGADNMIVKKVGNAAAAKGIVRGMQLVSIDGNFAWKEKGLDYLKELDWSAPPLPPLPPMPGRRLYGQPRGTVPGPGDQQQEEFNVEQEPGDNCKLQPGSSEPPPSSGEAGTPQGAGPPGQPAQQQKVLPCYPNGHTLSFKKRIPRWMRIGQSGGNCSGGQICCAMGANRKEKKGIFTEVCPSKNVCRPSESCAQVEGRPGICKYQVQELKEDHEDDEKEEEAQDDKEEKEAAEEERKEMQQEQEEEKPKDNGGSFF